MIDKAVLERVKERVRHRVLGVVEHLNETIRDLREAARELEEKGLYEEAERVRNATARLEVLVGRIANMTREGFKLVVAPRDLARMYHGVHECLMMLKKHATLRFNLISEIAKFRMLRGHLEMMLKNIENLVGRLGDEYGEDVKKIIGD